MFSCPADRAKAPDATSYLAVPSPDGSGVLSLERDQTEVPSNRILVVEVRNSGINWLKPADYEIGDAPYRINNEMGIGLGSHHGGGAYALFADRSVRFLNEKMDAKTLEALLRAD